MYLSLIYYKLTKRKTSYKTNLHILCIGKEAGRLKKVMYI